MTDPTMNSPRERADALVAGFGRFLGVDDAQLDANGDRSFGEVGFRYDPASHSLIGRAYVAKLRLDTGGAQRRESVEKNLRALNDPAIGGMFERGGGHFIIDEQADRGRGMLFLAKAFPVATTRPRELRRDMEELMNLAATWTMHWVVRVARIAHGMEQPPTRPVTRNDIAR